VILRHPDPIVGLKRLDNQNGVLVTSHAAQGLTLATLHVTHDGGRTWGTSTGRTLNVEVIDVEAVDFIDATNAWMVVTDKSLVRHLVVAADGGRTWRDIGVVPGGNADRIRVSLKLTSVSACWLGFGETLLTTNDGGQTWTRIKLPSEVEAVSLTAIDTRRAWMASSSGEILTTMDGGATWKR
jgi:photosystem II stability/assembly factor-like uncharacterized protein